MPRRVRDMHNARGASLGRASLNKEILRADEDETRSIRSSSGLRGRELGYPRRNPPQHAASSGTIPTCKNPGNHLTGFEEIWAALNIEGLRANEGEAKCVWSNTGMQGRGKREIPEKTHRPATSFGTIPTFRNPVPQKGKGVYNGSRARVAGPNIPRPLMAKVVLGETQNYGLSGRPYLPSAKPRRGFTRSELAGAKNYKRPLASQTGAARISKMAARTGHKHVRTPSTNQRLATSSPANGTTDRKSWAARGSQSDSWPFPDPVTLGFLHVGIVSDDTAGRRVFSVISHLSHPFIPVLLHTHLA
ncbi:hypothetical protein PR048_032093 [Dryococelus australis]|uniref:Uncharacterized protein n=1 Tax=Dryococelus australis TaxID=614101 RepID=A0ABQ9G190_9NEOP|nr:hypothetical protein PR048_032093 [Dryococelus australis]